MFPVPWVQVQGSVSGPYQARVPSAAGCEQDSVCLQSHCNQSSPQALRQVLSVPPGTLQTRPAFFHCPKSPDSLALPRLQDPERDAPSVPTAPSFFPEGLAGCSKFAGPAGAAHPVRGGGRGEGGWRAGRGRTREPELLGGQEREEQERAASVLPFSSQRCHTRSTEVSGALEGVAGGRRPGTTQVRPRPRPPRAPGSARCSRIPHAQPPTWVPSPSPPPPPTPAARRRRRTFPSPQAPPACTPGPFPRVPGPRAALLEEKAKLDGRAEGAGGAGAGARRKGKGEGTYFARCGAERCRREIKARLPATGSPASVVLSAPRCAPAAGHGDRTGTGTGTGTGARAARLGGRCAPARLGPAPRGSAPGSPLAPGTNSGQSHDAGAARSASLPGLAGCCEVRNFVLLHPSTIMLCLTTGPRTTEPWCHGLKPLNSPCPPCSIRLRSVHPRDSLTSVNVHVYRSAAGTSWLAPFRQGASVRLGTREQTASDCPSCVILEILTNIVR
ncbi:uncharacterized protein LOC101726257 [Heterocephalus glaber]|uniref:Uncharacterized protein LOC101726257 n=1 Tax=Heterocephalus glaber TaxID=10181 RepID=A0AAX6S431_HETGA|nr:uncharacterized protein LOC101726257 [Heterocephalus glaber]